MYFNNELVGVFSFGFNPQCTNAVDSVYTQTRFHIDWILEQINRTTIPLAGPTPAPGVLGASFGVTVNPINSILLIILATFMYYLN